MDQGWGMKEITPACPRCGSSNTKFCYYNNYSLTQPRYFCKGCRRYWTKGGSLRNIPVGGGCRKSRRCNRSSSSSSSASHLRTLNGQHLIASTNTSMMMMMSNSSPLSSSSTTSSTIDLAVVYANFLNPKHRNLNQEKPSSSSELLLSDGNIDHHHHHQVVDHDFISVNPTFDISSINLGTTSHSMFNPTTKTTMAAADSSSNGQLLSSHDHLLYLADDEHQLILHHHPKRTQFHSYDQEFTPLPNLHTSHGTTTCSNETASRNELINNISLPPLPGEEEHHHQDTTVPPPPFQDSNLQLWDHHTPDNNNYGNRDEHDVLQSITNGMTTDQQEKMEPSHHQFSYSSFIRDCWNPIDDFNHDVQTSNGSVAGATSTVTAAVVVTPTTSFL